MATREDVIDQRFILHYHHLTQRNENLLRPIIVNAFEIMERYYLREYTKVIREYYTARGIPIRKENDPIPVRVGSRIAIGSNEEAAKKINQMNRLLEGIAQAAMERGYASAPIKGVVFGAGFDIGKESFRRLAWINPYKGLDEFTSNQIDTIVQNGVKEGHGLGKIRSALKRRFAGIKTHKANLIIRSESTRYQNGGLIAGYDMNPVIGAKKWVAVLDKFTRPWHRSKPRGVHGQIRLIDEYFDVPGGPNPQQLMPSEPHCRCVVNSVTDKRLIKQAYKRAGRPYPKDGIHRPTGAASLPPNEHFAHGQQIEFDPINPVGLKSVEEIIPIV